MDYCDLVAALDEFQSIVAQKTLVAVTLYGTIEQYPVAGLRHAMNHVPSNCLEVGN